MGTGIAMAKGHKSRVVKTFILLEQIWKPSPMSQVYSSNCLDAFLSIAAVSYVKFMSRWFSLREFGIKEEFAVRLKYECAWLGYD